VGHELHSDIQYSSCDFILKNAGKCQLEIPRSIREHNIKMHVRKIRPENRK
jgi:hypothetical protein